jgi:hypothetical protein
VTSAVEGQQLLDLDVDLSQHLDELVLDESDDEDEPVLRWKAVACVAHSWLTEPSFRAVHPDNDAMPHDVAGLSLAGDGEAYAVCASCSRLSHLGSGSSQDERPSPGIQALRAARAALNSLSGRANGTPSMTMSTTSL